MGDFPAAPTPAPLTLGTAGHIDHGKTALVAALTDQNTDRLPEERSRGISIELGYAGLTLPSGRRLSIVDVPGHERFVRTMVAGATGVDLYLLVVAADDGVMPQTREHATVLAGLEVRDGVVAVTKSDLLDPGPAADEAAALVREVLGREAEPVAVSARTGAGLPELLAALDAAAAALPGRGAGDAGAGDALLHVDRSFTIRGAGTVVTGTLWAGSIGRGDALAVLTGSGRIETRARSVQVHDVPTERAAAGQRVAVNLTGVERGEVGRGDVLVAAGSDLGHTHLVDAALELGPARERVERAPRVHVHHGTREAPARAIALGGDFFQLRLEQPLLASAGDRLIVRQIAPPDTLGGGVVLDPRPRKHAASPDVVARLGRLARGERPAEESPRQPEPPAAPAEPQPLSPAALEAARRLRDAGLNPPPDAELASPEDLAALRRAGHAVRVARNLHYHPEALEEARRRVVATIERDGSATIASLRDELRTSRKFAQALLEHFDGEKVTRRVGDTHVLRRR